MTSKAVVVLGLMLLVGIVAAFALTVPPAASSDTSTTQGQATGPRFSQTPNPMQSVTGKCWYFFVDRNGSAYMMFDNSSASAANSTAFSVECKP